MSTASFTQLTARFRNDDGNEAAATWIAAQGTNASLLTSLATFRVRFRIDETASVSWTNKTWNLRYSLNGGSYTAVSGSTPVQFALSANFADGADSTTQLTGGTGTFVTDNNGMKEATGGATNSGSSGNLFEVEWCLKLDAAQLASGNTIDLRVYDGTSAIAAYTFTPRITVLMARTLTAAAATFTVTGNATALKRGLKLPADAATFVITGNAQSLLWKHVIAAASRNFAITGGTNNLLWKHTLPAAAGSFAINGNNAGLAKGFMVSASAGSFALTGNAVSFRHIYQLGAANGSFAITGNPANLLRSLKITAVSRAFNITGNATGLLWKHILPAAAGSFAITGRSANLTHGYKVTASPGGFAIIGNAQSLLWKRRMPAVVGSFALSGSSVNLLRGKTISGSAGGFAMNGNAAGLLHTRVLTANFGAFNLSGNAANLLRGSLLTAQTRTFVLTGFDAAFTQGGGVIVFDPPNFPISFTVNNSLSPLDLNSGESGAAISGGNSLQITGSQNSLSVNG